MRRRTNMDPWPHARLDNPGDMDNIDNIYAVVHGGMDNFLAFFVLCASNANRALALNNDVR
jgi:hypothetical protein